MWMNDNNSQNALALLPLRGHSQSTPTSYRRQNQKDRLDLLCYILTRESRKSCVSKFISIEMVLNCVVQGCTTKSRKGLEVSFHHFPIKDLERCKKWLRAINHPKFGEDTDMGNLKTRRICSRHFKEEDYEPNVLAMKRTTLKDTAIPSIFTFPDDEQPGPSGIKRIRLEPPIASAGLVSSDDEGKLLLTSTPVKIPTSVHEQFSPCPSTPGGLNTTISSIEAVGDDESYQPESTITFTSTSSSSSSDEGEKDWREKKLIVNESSLMSLFKFCQMCGKPISSKTIVDVGAQRKVQWICLGGHAGTWKSSRDVRGMPEVNLLAAAAVLFRGGTYTELSDWCKTMGVQMIGHSTFYNIQKIYLHPVIEELYCQKRDELLARVYLEQEDGKRLHLTGDGRCDTPGFSAKYCHYTFMLDDTKEILHTELVQVN
ncbi:uncharacterized protein [Misgurnus anguillicaudatus]|uniref:uncharacterized protein n=1 Tax=Misgurnus anguillicaudatus TaxID=75329 RepID=UPI003CCF06AF